MISAVGRELCHILEKAGYKAVCPSLNPLFRMLADYTSNWSERHAAHICGLGTFGLSKGLITSKGIAGRFGSVITSCAFPVTKRPYEGLTDYCIMCGKCSATVRPMQSTKPKAAWLGKITCSVPRISKRIPDRRMVHTRKYAMAVGNARWMFPAPPGSLRKGGNRVLYWFD